MTLKASHILARWRVLFVFGVLILVGGVRALEFTHNRGYEPTQPIPFSHRLHAGELGMDCLYCHSNAEKSKHASVPPVDTCMGCHTVVATDKPDIQRLTEYWERGESVPWVRIHSLPDHAYFNHAAHVNAGVACQTCHGPIQEMEIVYQYVDLSMGWCIECHRNDDYLRTPERLAIQGEQNQFAHSYFHQGDPRRVDANALRANYASLAGDDGGIWGADSLNAAAAEYSPRQVATMIAEAIGYNNFAWQQGPAPDTDHVAAFQNANVNCNTCHY